MTRPRARLLGLLASLTILLLTVATPLALIAMGAAPWDLDLGDAGDLLRSPDDGHLAVGLLAVTAWLAWVVMTVSIGIEIVARARGVRTPRLPALAAPQQAAGRLVALTSLLFVAVPTVTPLLAPATAQGSSQVSEDTLIASAAVAADASPPHENDATPRAETETELTTIDHTVKRGETLWKIANQHLGDGARWREIFGINNAVLGDRPDFILPGTVLRVPTVEEQSSPDETYVVRPGDTLSGIAESVLGSPERYPEIFEASQTTVQPNGHRLTDPDMILPGWHLTIPASNDPDIPEVTEPKPDVRQPDDAEHPTTDPSHTPAPSAEPSTGYSLVPENVSEEPSDSEVTPSWLLPGLAGAGALLAGSLWLTLRSRRRTQLRYRRPGEVIAPPPQELRNVEKSAHASGAPAATSLEVADRLLRHLAAVTDTQGDVPPDLLLAELCSESLTLHLASAAELAVPWDGADTVWTAPLDAAVEDIDQIAPYPLLVTIGQSADGHLWLANLEAIGPVSLTGDRDNAEKLARHISAELILNPWASLVDVELLGIGDELAPLDPMRLHTHLPGDDAFLSQFSADLERASDRVRPERFRALVSEGPIEDDLYERIVAAHTLRSGVAVVAVLPRDESGSTSFALEHDQTLRSPKIGVDLSAAGLTADEAAACAAIVDLTRIASTDPVVATAESQGQEEVAAEPRGSTDGELTEPRPDGPAGQGSLLPLSNLAYSDRAATTDDELDAMAPVIPSESRPLAQDPDPDLDTDLEAWLDPVSSLPRLTLLGPVGVRACGDPKAVVKRKPYYTEVLAYLALHPDGVTSAKLADDFGITTSRARVDANAVRTWLGDNTRTGRRHVPDANESDAAAERGVPTYQVEDLLSDLDLFRRLRARGEARGADGIHDLVQALKLVTGQPFDQLRPGGWAWLLEGDRVDHTVSCAVVDVAHLVATHALGTEDIGLAETAANIAHRAAPHDEIAKLDLVAALAAGGHQQEAERLLHDDVFNRRDDDLGPADLPERTAKIVRQRGWKPAHSNGA